MKNSKSPQTKVDNSSSTQPLKPHGNRKKVFPNQYIPNTEHLDMHKLVTDFRSKNKAELMAIFSETKTIFQETNKKLGGGLQSLFKNNVLFLCDLHGIGLNDLFRKIKLKGIRGSYQSFLNGQGKRYYSILYVAMFSRIFEIEPWKLIGLDLRAMHEGGLDKPE